MHQQHSQGMQRQHRALQRRRHNRRSCVYLWSNLIISTGLRVSRVGSVLSIQSHTQPSQCGNNAPYSDQDASIKDKFDPSGWVTPTKWNRESARSNNDFHSSKSRSRPFWIAIIPRSKILNTPCQHHEPSCHHVFTDLSSFSFHNAVVPGSGIHISLIIIRTSGLRTGTRDRKILMQYLSDQLWNTQR